jgi:two-component system nitrate/nitrite sensor histidine kinase NarX
LHVIVRDNGRGFRFGNARFQSQAHMGFHTMRERAESLGGELWVDSSLGRGACVWAVIPLAHT